MLGVASQEQGQAQQIRTVGCLDENRSRGVKAIREGFHKEVMSAPGGEGCRSVREGCPSVWG